MRMRKFLKWAAIIFVGFAVIAAIISEENWKINSLRVK